MAKKKKSKYKKYKDPPRYPVIPKYEEYIKRQYALNTKQMLKHINKMLK